MCALHMASLHTHDSTPITWMQAFLCKVQAAARMAVRCFNSDKHKSAQSLCTSCAGTYPDTTILLRKAEEKEKTTLLSINKYKLMVNLSFPLA